MGDPGLVRSADALERALAAFARTHQRDQAITLACLCGHFTMAAMAQHFGAHYTTVSQLVGAQEAQRTDGA